MRKATITKFIGHLQGVLNSGLTRAAYAISKDLSNAYFANTFSKVIQDFKKGSVRIDDFNTVVDLMSQIDSSYTKYKNLVDEVYVSVSDDTREKIAETLKKMPKLVSSSSDEDISEETTLETVSDEEPDDDRNSIEFERDENGRIKFYKFKVLIRDKEPLTGKLSRDEMNMIYRMYSYYGMSITQREVSRYFPEYSLIDFKRILRVFNITKASSPFAPHVIEEHSSEELVQMQLREKENDFLRVLEKERIKNNEKLLKNYALDNAKLKEQLSEGKYLLEGLDLSFLQNVEVKPTLISKVPNKTDILIWISDMHIGAAVSDQSIYPNKYDEDEVNLRLSKIAAEVANLSKLSGGFDNIVVCNIGDSLDGMDRQTTRRDHFLPQNMTNKEQLQSFIRVMSAFFLNLKSIPCNSIKYYCVGESNHDGDFGYAANLALGAILDSTGIENIIYDKFIGHFNLKNKTYILCHGKDNKDMFKNLPLTLDVKTENFINEYLDFYKLSGDVTFIKGDLHQSATTYGRRFKYKSVASVFGSSEWIHKNFGNTPAACDYSVVDYNTVLDGHILLQ